MSGVIALKASLDAPVSALKEIGDANTARLNQLGIETIRDLLLTLPYAFESYGAPAPIASITPDTAVTVVGRVMSIAAKVTRFKKMSLTEAIVGDESGGELRLVWFNQAFMAKNLHKGDRIAVAGTAKRGRYGALEISNPYYERLEGDEGKLPSRVGGLMPKYHLVSGLTNKKIAGWVEQALPLAGELDDVLPEDVRTRHGLLDVATAVRKGHKPASDEDYRQAHHRMAFAEVFELQVGFALIRARIAGEQATPIPYDQSVIDTFKAGLGFELTRAQKKAMWDAFRDMSKSFPMNRLLNGDVGSGKTAVAAACAAMAHAAGLQTVVMAPTEILARQHLTRFRAYLEETIPGLTVELLVSSQSAPERRRVRAAAASGHCALVVGTHALIEDDVDFANLGLAVVDEQHRFGTRQRELLRAKGTGRPHFLAMTATPIPRTLALAEYGEMTVSVIDEMPLGRTPIETEVIEPNERFRAYELVREEVGLGHQAFVICPLIEESETVVARSAVAEAKRLQDEVFPELKVDVIHGRMKEKDEVMKRFVSGETNVLVATAVVEVGVDVPNATVMLIEGADRFGLAQLHQFRGRIGRGAAKSYCRLLAEDPSEGAFRRLNLVAQLRDGFRLAEADLDLRGAGQLMGPRQHGLSDAAMNSLREPKLLDEARDEALAVVEMDPQLAQHSALRKSVERRMQLVSLS
ncbi:MAG TPA: ATP-dependent DNA helicase RecG [Candidatus Dormibacteraeota bacterium]|nr:ATP-dependent DNA helicase RecG [Candidatus Dormibacteraeota bacterium]